MVKTKDTISKASKGLINDFMNSDNSILTGKDQLLFGSLPVFDRKKALEAVRKDYTVLSALNTLVDKAMEAGYLLNGVDGKSKSNTADTTLREDLRLTKILRQTFFNLFTYGNVFIENIKDGNGKIKELHVLETTHTEPVVTKHGKVLGYVQILPDGSKPTQPKWKPDEVTHLAITKLTTSIWGELDVEAIYTTVLTKQYVMQYLGWLYGTNQAKGFFNIKNANEQQVKEFVSFLRRAEKDISKPVIAAGEITYQLLRDFKDIDQVINLLNKLDQNILSLMQVPPISAGIAGDSNRSNSDAQDSSLNTRVKAVQDVVEDEFAFDLFPKIGFEKIRIIFNPLKKADISKLLEDAERMKILGFKPAIIEEFLKTEGFPIKKSLLMTDEELKKRAEMMITQAPDGESKSEDMFPSRKRNPEDEGNKRHGTGEKSTTREDQISKGATKTDKFGKWPYTYEVQK